jgi:hypothetical protein
LIVSVSRIFISPFGYDPARQFSHSRVVSGPALPKIGKTAPRLWMEELNELA